MACRTRVRQLLFILLVAMLLPWGGLRAGASEFTDQQKQALPDVLTSLSALGLDDLDKSMDFMPRKMLRFLAGKAGLDEKDYQAKLVAQLKPVLSKIKLVASKFDLQNIAYKQCSDGTPYVLVPYEGVFDLQDGKNVVKVKEYNIALIEDGSWRVIRINETAQLLLLREVYPEFVGVEFPSGSKELISK